jgi:hypothetical protein
VQRPESLDDIGFAPIGLDEPYRIVVGNNPVNFVDPLGLEGCGPGFFGDYVIPDSPFGFNFYSSCNRHDACYGSTGEAEGKKKQDCDKEFYNT